MNTLNEEQMLFVKNMMLYINNTAIEACARFVTEEGYPELAEDLLATFTFEDLNELEEVTKTI